MMGSLTKKEILFLGAISLILSAIALSLYFFALAHTPKDHVFTGVFLNPDVNTYFMRMEEVKQGIIPLYNLYTSESQKQLWIDPFWMPLGFIAKIFHVGTKEVYHFSKIFFIFFSVFSLHLLLKKYYANFFERAVGIIALFFGSGLGAFFTHFFLSNQTFARFSQASVDIFLVEAFPFTAVLYNPLYIVSTALLALIFLFYLEANQPNSKKFLVASSMSALILFSFHPYKVPVVWGTLGVFSFLLSFFYGGLRKTFTRLAILVLISAPAPIYYIWLFEQDKTFAVMNALNFNISPVWYKYVIGYGLFFPLAIAEIYRQKKLHQLAEPKNLLLLSWFFFTSYLLYSPFVYQRRFAEGLFIVVVIWSIAPLAKILRWTFNNLMNIKGVAVAMILIPCLVTTSIFNYLSYRATMARFSREPKSTLHNYDLTYLPKKDFQAIQYLQKHLDTREVILSSPYIGNMIPGIAARTVFMGHGPMSIYSEQKYKIVEIFFKDNENDLSKKQFLTRNNISYLYFGEFEDMMGSFDPASKDYLSKIYDVEGVKIFKIK